MRLKAIIIIILSNKLVPDVDECETDNGGCAQTCLNTLGSFLCFCNTGYSLADDDLGCDGKWEYSITLQ